MMSAGNDFSIGGYYEFGIGYAVNDDASLGFSTADAEMKKSKPKPLLARRPPHLSATVGKSVRWLREEIISSIKVADILAALRHLIDFPKK